MTASGRSSRRIPALIPAGRAVLRSRRGGRASASRRGLAGCGAGTQAAFSSRELAGAYLPRSAPRGLRFDEAFGAGAGTSGVPSARSAALRRRLPCGGPHAGSSCRCPSPCTRRRASRASSGRAENQARATHAAVIAQEVFGRAALPMRLAFALEEPPPFRQRRAISGCSCAGQHQRVHEKGGHERWA